MITHDLKGPQDNLQLDNMCNLQVDDVPGADFENSQYAYGQSRDSGLKLHNNINHWVLQGSNSRRDFTTI